MKTVSIKIDDSIFVETEKILSRIRKTRNQYVNEAIDYYNRHQRRIIPENQLQFESALVGKESLLVLNKFERMDYRS